jgi:hypothetical protein
MKSDFWHPTGWLGVFAAYALLAYRRAGRTA